MEMRMGVQGASWLRTWCRDCAPLAFAALILSEVFALRTLAQDDTGDASAALILS